MKKIKKGFTLIEILIGLGVLAILAVATISIYNRVETTSYTNKIMDDIKYSYSNYQNITTGKSASNFYDKGNCCDLSMTIDSNFPEIKGKNRFSAKYFLSPQKEEILIWSRTKLDPQDSSISMFYTFEYSINGNNIPPQLCHSIISTYIHSDDISLVQVSNEDGYSVMGENRLVLTSIPKFCGSHISSITVALKG